jgi:Domain of unknown function (DUF4442)
MASKKILEVLNNSAKFRWYLFYKLPAAFFSGIRIKSCTHERCVTSVPYKWLTQNPFRSTYFASLAMAAEMSTGALCMIYVSASESPVSMLLTHMEATYVKKAVDITLFSCENGLEIQKAVEKACAEAQGSSVIVSTTGRNKNNEVVAEFIFTWSFKKKRVNAQQLNRV